MPPPERVPPGPPTIDAIGGVFLASEDPARLIAWYRDLGIPVDESGMFMFSNMSVFSIMKAALDLPRPASPLVEEPYGQRRATLNLRVSSLPALIDALRARRIEVAGPRDYGYGVFAWVQDPDGNLVEMWEPAASPRTPGPVDAP